jgi:SAM-dependent methyltransferase
MRQVETCELFAHERVARGYASARPFLHREAFARVRELIHPAAPVRRALDVGCGTGLSSVALLELASRVVGLDASGEMLRHATRADRLHYVAAPAEAMPFRSGSVDLVAACGSLDWVDLEAFLPRAAEVLASGGFLVALDFGDLGRSSEISGLERWYREVFQKAYPRPPARDPKVTGEQAGRFGFTGPADHEFSSGWSFTAAQYAEFLMTESDVITAVEYGGQDADRVRRGLEAELETLFAERARQVAFGGYIQVLRRL